MTPSRVSKEPEWRQLLQLGEELLTSTHAVEQCRLIQNSVERLLHCQAEVWLAEPFYPLPGEPDVRTLPQASAPSPVISAFITHLTSYLEVDSQEVKTKQPIPTCHTVAIPVITQDNLLAVLQVQRPEKPFSASDLEFLDGIAAHAAVSLQISRQVVIKNWRYEQLALVRSVSSQINSLLDLDELSRQVTELIQKTFNYYYVAIFTLESEHQPMKFRASASANPAACCDKSFVVRLGQGIVGTVAQNGQEILAPNVQLEPRYHYVDVLPETQSEVALPLKIENQVLGVLDVQSDQLDAFHEIDMMVLHALADNIALAVEETRVFTDLQRKADEQAALFDISHALTSILDLDTLLDEVVSLIQKRFGHPFVHIYSVHPGRRKIIYMAGSGARSQAMHDAMVSFDLDDPSGILPWVARTGQTYLANNISLDPLYRPAVLLPLDQGSELSVPLKIGSEVLGVMDIQNNQIDAFDASDESLFETLAASIAIALRNATLFRTEQWRLKVAESFKDVANLLPANIALEKLLTTILTRLEKNLPCEAAAIWLLEDIPDGKGGKTRGLRLAAVYGISEEKILEARQKSASVRDFLATALESSETSIRKSGDPYGPLGAALDFPPDYSSIAAPLRSNDQPLGVLTLAHHTANRYGSEARTMTSTFASYAAVAIHNSRLYSSTQEQAWISTVLLQVSEASQSTDDIDSLISTMVRLTPLLVGVKKCAMFLWDDSIQEFILKAWYGLDTPPAKVNFHEDEIPALAHLRSTHETVFIDDVQRELNMPSIALPEGFGTIVILPLVAHGNFMGAFLIAHQADSHLGSEVSFNQKTLSILQGIAHQTTIALDNLQLIEARQEEAYVTAALLQVAQAVVSQNELADILDTIIHLMPILVGIDATAIYLWDEAHTTFTPFQAFSTDHAQEDHLCKRSYERGQFALLDRAGEKDALYFSILRSKDQDDSEWPDLPSFSVEILAGLPVENNTSLLLAIPISIKGEVFGIMLAKDPGVVPGSLSRRLEIINGVVQQTALAIQNERFKKEMVSRERMERELQLARQIQETFLPSSFPVLENWEFDARWQTARQVGGDFYDIFSLPNHRLGLVIADVSDKGLPAALYMTVTRTLIRGNVRGHNSPAAVLERVNNLLASDSQNGMFITAAYGILTPATGELIYANAGHNRPLLRLASTGEVAALAKGGIALGVIDHIKLQDHVTILSPGDSLILYTDGVTESFSPEGENFGEERLKQVISTCDCSSICHLLDALDHALLEFRENTAPTDDVTLLGIRRLK